MRKHYALCARAANRMMRGVMPDTSLSPLAAWLRLASHPRTVRRAAITALIVGSVLIAINHGPAIVRGQLSAFRGIQMGLTVLVPYIVSTVSSVATRRELEVGKLCAD